MVPDPSGAVVPVNSDSSVVLAADGEDVAVVETSVSDVSPGTSGVSLLAEERSVGVLESMVNESVNNEIVDNDLVENETVNECNRVAHATNI